MFAYCLNNPLIYDDDSGKAAGLVGSILVSAAIGGLLGGVSAALSGENILEGIIFGATSAVIGVVASPIVAARINAVTSFGKNVIDQVIDNKRKGNSKEIDYSAAFISAGYAFAGTYLGGKLAEGAAVKDTYSVAGNAVANWIVGLATSVLEAVSQSMRIISKRKG